MAIRTVAWKQFRDEDLRMALGLYPSLTQTHILGRNLASADGTEEEVTKISAAYVFPASALMTNMSQTTDDAAVRGLDIEIVGLDNNFDEVTQTVLLNASNSTTAVALTTALRRVNSMRILSNATLATPIRLHNAAESTDYSIIAAGDNKALSAVYTVPNNKTAFMTNVYAQKNFGGGEPTDLQIYGYERENIVDGVGTRFFSVGLDPDGGIAASHEYRPYKKFQEKTDIYIAASATGAAADVTAGFDLILVDDNDN